MNIGQTLFRAQAGGLRSGVVKGGAVEQDVGAVALGVVDLDQRCGGGHDDGGGDAGVLGGVGHTLGVVAGGGGDQAGGLLLVGEGADGEVGAANFVRAGDLHILRLQVDVVAGGVGEKMGVNQAGVVQHPFQHVAGCLKIFQSHHGGIHLLPFIVFKPAGTAVISRVYSIVSPRPCQ